MKTIQAILVALLIISGLLPVPVITSALFNPSSAALMLGLGDATVPIRNVLQITGAFMLSFILMFGLAAYWVAKNNPSGIMLSFFLGIITLLRGVLLFGLFASRSVPAPFLATIASIDGTLIIIVSVMARNRPA